MSAAKHTPGPWKAAPFRVQIPLADGGHVDGPLMSYFVGGRHSGEGMTVSFGSERVADHYLAAAAPDLLEAAEWAALCLRQGDSRGAEVALRAAIAKATGDQP